MDGVVRLGFVVGVWPLEGTRRLTIDIYSGRADTARTRLGIEQKNLRLRE